MNELYAIHHNGTLLYEKPFYERPFRTSRKVYPTYERALAALRQIPKATREEFTIVRYIPEGEEKCIQ